MLFQPQAITPVIIKVVPPPTQEVSIVSVVLGALGLTGLIAVAAIFAGVLFGIALILVKRWKERRNPDEDTLGTRLDLSSR